MREADLTEADLKGAILREADLTNAMMVDADLRGADLRGANLKGVEIHSGLFNNLKDAIVNSNTRLPDELTDEQYNGLIWK